MQSNIHASKKSSKAKERAFKEKNVKYPQLAMGCNADFGNRMPKRKRSE